MDSPFEPRKPRRPKATRLMAIDAWIDSTLYEAGFKASEIWESLTIFSRRFRFMGWKRAVFEIFGEGFTLGAAGCVVMLALALPAFEATAGNWRAQDDFAVTFLDRYGNEIGKRGIIQRDTVPLDEMPDHLIKAVLATEDRRFFEHFGIDVLGTDRARCGKRARQFRGPGRIVAVPAARQEPVPVQRAHHRAQDQGSLPGALARGQPVEEGDPASSTSTAPIWAAAISASRRRREFYFGKSVKDVNLAEAAMLAGLFKAPARYAPHINLPAARARANEVLTNMVQAGFMTEGQVHRRASHPANVIDRRHRRIPDYFLDWAFDEVKKLTADRAIRSIVRTTIDLACRRRRKSRSRQSAPARRRLRRQAGAVVVMEVDGAVRAMVGGRDYGESQFNRATDALRQPGSSFKPYVYATAMERLHAGLRHIRRADLLGQLVAEKLRPQLFRRRRPDHRAGQVDQHRAGPARQGLSEHPADQGDGRGHGRGIGGEFAQDHGARHIGHDRHGSGDRLQRLHEQRLFRARDTASPRSSPAPATCSTITKRTPRKPRRVLSDQALRSMNSMLVQVPERGTARKAALPNIRSARQDRHDAVLSRRLVYRLHRQLPGRRLARQRRFLADAQDDRRLASCDDLAAADDLCPPERRHQADPRHRERIRRRKSRRQGD